MLNGCSKPTNAIETKNNYYQVADIDTIEPSSRYSMTRNYIGKVISKQFSAVSFEYSGMVENIFVDSGDKVKKGQLLAELNTELLLINQLEVSARIEQLTAQAKLNKLNLQRARKLAINGYSSQQTIDELITEQQVIKADLARQHANKAGINYQISKAKLFAPFNATVSTRAVAEGEFFSPNQMAFELIKLAHHEISVGVPINVANNLTVGEALSVNLNDKQLFAKILVIGKQINAASRTVELRLSIEQQANFYNGQLAQVKIEQTIEQTGFWLPLSALTDGIRGQWNIYLVEPSQKQLFKIKAATVEVIYTTTERAFISGLPKQTHQIINSGVHRYVPGQQVKNIANTASISSAEPSI